jgi:hypothetical protein
MEKWHSLAFGGTGGTFLENLMGWVVWYYCLFLDGRNGTNIIRSIE